MSGTRVMTLGAIPAGGYPGSGGPIPAPYTEPYGRGPEWLTNYITNPVVNPELAQNRMRVWNKEASNMPVGFSSGQPVHGSVLGGLGSLALTLLAPSPLVVSPNNRPSFPGGFPRFAGLGCGCGCNGKPGGCGGGVRGLGAGEVFTESEVFDDPSSVPIVPAPPPRPAVVDINAVQAAELRSRIGWFTASAVGAVVGAYHGYNRNRRSTGWGIAWAMLGATFPLITTGVAAVQGFGKPKG